MKKFDNAYRRDVQYNIDDWVLVKLQPYCQAYVTDIPYSKLNKCFYGPFQIPEKARIVSYNLILPQGSKIYLFFHCSMLKPFHTYSSSLVSVVTLPPSTLDNQPIITPIVILNNRWTQTIEPRIEVLVQQKGLHVDDTSWEDQDNLKHTYHLEDNVLSYGVHNHIIWVKYNTNEVAQDIAKGKPNKKAHMPNYLEDYIT